MREAAEQLGISKSTFHRLQQDLPLQDITNIARCRQRKAISELLEDPAACLPRVNSLTNAYLTLNEEEILLKIIADRAANELSVGKTPIRRFAQEIRMARPDECDPVELPSSSWYDRFRRRHVDGFRQKKPAVKEYKRADAERGQDIRAFFDEYKAQLDLHAFPPHCIFAMDETGIAGEAGLNERVWVPSGSSAGVQLTGSFREHISIMHVCHADGVSLPPIFIFQGSWTPVDILAGAPEGSRVSMQESGYFEKPHLLAVFEHIMTYVGQHPDMYQIVGSDGQSVQRELLLILDGATQHFDSAALQYAADSKMTVLKLPAHLTHIMQVSDVGVFGPFKKAYGMACEEWRESSKGLITKYHMAAIVSKAWTKSVTPDNVKSGFRATGQHPYDPNQVLKRVSPHSHIHLPPY